jgi:hypothetical protein
MLRIAERLQSTPGLLSAACTFPSVATAPIGVRLLAAILPVLFSFIALWRLVGREGALKMQLLFVPVFGSLVLSLWQFKPE